MPQIDPNAAVSSITPGSGASDLGKAEDAAHTSGDVGVMSLAVRRDAFGTPEAGTTGDYIPLVTNAYGQARVEVGGVTKVISASFTRPNDTTAYAAGDAVNNSTSAPTVITFTSAARVSGGSGIIIGATLTKSTNGSTGDSFDLHLFDTTVTLANDNAADAASDGEVLTYIGTINFSAATDTGANNRAYMASGINLPFVTVGSANLFGKLVARGAYAPGAQEVFNIRLLLQQD